MPFILRAGDSGATETTYVGTPQLVAPVLVMAYPQLFPDDALDNPTCPGWLSNTEMVWDGDLGFDGVAAKASYEFSNGLTPFAVAGAFPIYNTDLNAGFNLDQDNNFPSKSKSHDKYLFGGQIGLGGQVAEDYSFKVAASFFDFSNVKGKLSSPCFVSSASF